MSFNGVANLRPKHYAPRCPYCAVTNPPSLGKCAHCGAPL